MRTSFPCISCGHSIEVGDDCAGAATICPNCKALTPAPAIKKTTPAGSEEDGWITAKAPRSRSQAELAKENAIVADDLDSTPYLVEQQDADGAFDETPSAADPPPDGNALPSVALPKKRRGAPCKHGWEATASFRTRLWIFLAYETLLFGFGLALLIGQESSWLEVLVIGLVISALAAYVLGTYDRVNLTRDYEGRVVLSKTWRFCFIPLKTNKIALRGFHAVATTANAEREILDWIMFAWLLSLGILPGILWWVFVMSKPVHLVALAKDHGLPAVILYQGVDQEHAHDIAKNVSAVCRYRWRKS